MKVPLLYDINISVMKKILLFSAIMVSIGFVSLGRDYKITSPDGKISVIVNVDKEITWSASFDNKEIINSAKVAMLLADGKILGANEVVRKSTSGRQNDTIKPVVANKKSMIIDDCNTLSITFRSGFTLSFKAYNDGIAYRFETSLKDTLIIRSEVSELQFPAGSFAWYPQEKSFMSHNENTFLYVSLDTIVDRHLASLPTLFKVGDINILLTESDIEDYPGMWLRGAGSGRISGIWPAYPEEEKLNYDRNLRVTRTKEYIAKTTGTRTFPWRTFVITSNDGALIESDLVYKLAAPNRLKDTKWIKPGKVAWDWWNANNIYGVDFRAGINNDTYKYYIDFASKNNLEYVILDEGWYKLGNVLDVTPGLDVPGLCKYAESRNVGIILWVVWKTFYDRIDTALDQWEQWGIKGIKVDFMQRDDQKMVNFYYEAARKAAEHHMLIDFHGSYKPDGLGRTYPNALTREGVKGMEHDKWSKEVSPVHDVTIPFTRMVAGPMDYTPGAMINMDRINFQPLFTRPSSQGTRVHQIALYIVYESPLQMLSDSPSNYMREQESTDFIVKVPVVWDDIKVLQAKVGSYLLLARRSGNEWYIGGLTDWTMRDLNLDLSFLGSGDYRMEIFQDGINADRYAGDYKHLSLDVRPDSKMQIHLAPGGGWAARISPK
jgi:alpha-glucosidase